MHSKGLYRSWKGLGVKKKKICETLLVKTHAHIKLHGLRHFLSCNLFQYKIAELKVQTQFCILVLKIGHINPKHLNGHTSNSVNVVLWNWFKRDRLNEEWSKLQQQRQRYTQEFFTYMDPNTTSATWCLQVWIEPPNAAWQPIANEIKSSALCESWTKRSGSFWFPPISGWAVSSNSAI